MEASCTVQTLRNSCKFFSESDKKKLAKAISKNQVRDRGPSWPSCLFEMHFKMSSAICFNLDQSKILSSGNGLSGVTCIYFTTM